MLREGTMKDQEKGKGKGKMRALLARFSLDGHDRGLLSVMSSFRDRGIEVVYTYFSDPKELTKAAEQEDVDIIGISSSMGEHFYIASNLVKVLNEQKIEIPVIMGGVIPTRDIPELLGMGIKKVFRPGSAPGEIVDFVFEISKN